MDKTYILYFVIGFILASMLHWPVYRTYLKTVIYKNKLIDQLLQERNNNDIIDK
jgi:hypothetical protein